MKRYIIILMVAFAAVACKKQDSFEEPAAGAGETLFAHIGGPESKVEFNPSSGKFAWSDPDEIALHLSTGSYRALEVTASGVFTFVSESGETRDGYAIYPADFAAGTAAAPAVTLPASYDITAEGMGNWYPTPMIAVNDPADDDLWFYHVGAALRLTLNNVPSGTEKIAVCFGKGVTGTFEVADPSTDGPTIAPTAAVDVVTFVLDEALASATNGLVVNVPLPAGTYPMVSVSAKNGSDVEIKGGGDYREWKFPRGRGRQLTYDFDLDIVGSHEFSVSSVKKVEFAPGNLWNISGTWQFAPKQYSRLGEVNDAWELFGLSTDVSGNNYGMNTSVIDTDYFQEDCEFVDWGTAATDAGLGEGWRTLQGREWAYLLGKFEYVYQHDPNAVTEEIISAPIIGFGRNNGNPHALRGYATIYTADAAIQGFVILPDAWTTPEGCRPFVGGRWSRASGEDAYLDNTYNAGGTAGTSGDWARMEAAGAVFLPGCGLRIGPDLVLEGQEIKYHAYWTSSYEEDSGWITICVFVSNDDDNYGFGPLPGVGPSYGCAVRLVKDVSVGSLDNLEGEVGNAGQYGQGTL